MHNNISRDSTKVGGDLLVRIAKTQSISKQMSDGRDDVKTSGKQERTPIVKGCFIATAAMGSAMHPHVELLRQFRDEILLQSKYKGAFERLLDKYYLLSPPVARRMNQSHTLKLLLRYALVYPVVFGIKGILPVVDGVLGIKKDALKRQRAGTERQIQAKGDK